MNKKTKVTRSSGNVFADIGLRNADELQMKAQIVMVLTRLIESKGLSQTAAAKRVGIAQPDLSKILRGNFSGFSLERLLGAVRALGSDVEIKVKAKPSSNTEGKLCLLVA
jgi:predicted XRE-type DNA-binding protein